MALRQAFKITRLLKQYQYNLACHLKNKSTFVPISKNGSTSNVQSKWANNKASQDIQTTEQNNIVAEQVQNYDEADFKSKSLTENLDESVPIRRKFAKSSTHNAVTMSLKPSRLASPFPEPVKTMASDTVSDEEKSRQMQEEVKMEARFVLQQQKEMLLKLNAQKQANKRNSLPNLQNSIDIQKAEIKTEDARPQTIHGNLRFNYNRNQNQNFPLDKKFNKAKFYQAEEQLKAINNKGQMVRPQTQYLDNARKIEERKKLHAEKQESLPHLNIMQFQNHHGKTQDNQLQQQNQIQLKENSKSIEQVDKTDKSKQKRGRRIKTCRTRSSRFLRNSKSNMLQTRKYSSYSDKYQNIEPPEPEPQLEQCDVLLKRLKALHPKYKNWKKPVFLPGTNTEKEFIKRVLALIKELKDDSYKLTSPYASYSEMNNIREQNNDETNLNRSFIKPNSRNYSTTRLKKTRMFKRDIWNQYSNASSVIQNPYQEQNRLMRTNKQTRYINHKEKHCAPYQSYSEFKINSTNSARKNENKSKRKYASIGQYQRSNKTIGYKHYSTSANVRNAASYGTGTYYQDEYMNDEMVSVIEAKEKKPKPCKNPHPNIPVCDYEETARKSKDKREGKKGKQPIKKKKAGAASFIEAANETLQENENVIRKIKQWLQTWQPQSDNIKITKCSSVNNMEDRETYVIEIVETVNSPIREEHIKSELISLEDVKPETNNVEYLHASEPLPAEFSDTDKVLIQNIPDYMTLDNLAETHQSEVLLDPKKKDKCPQGKKKKDKCRQTRKKKLPSCDNIKKKSMENILPDIEESEYHQSRYIENQVYDEPSSNYYENYDETYVYETPIQERSQYSEKFHSNDQYNAYSRQLDFDQENPLLMPRNLPDNKNKSIRNKSQIHTNENSFDNLQQGRILKDNKFSTREQCINEPFKLKKQFWRK